MTYGFSFAKRQYDVWLRLKFYEIIKIRENLIYVDRKFIMFC